MICYVNRNGIAVPVFSALYQCEGPPEDGDVAISCLWLSAEKVVVLIPYTSSAYGRLSYPVGKSYATKVDDEKSALQTGHRYKQKSRYLYHKPI